jgi:hypothetical protein
MEKPVRIVGVENTENAWITHLECGCQILQPKPTTLDILYKRIPEPIWMRCTQHRNSKPEEIIISRE